MQKQIWGCPHKFFGRMSSAICEFYHVTALLTHHYTIGHEEHHPSKDMNHKEGHWQPTQVIILTAAKDIAVACNRAKCQKMTDCPVQNGIYCVVYFILNDFFFFFFEKKGKSSTKTGSNYSSQNKYLVLKIVPLPSFHLQLRGSFVPHRDPLPLAGFPWLVHLCPGVGGCRWDSMGSAVPGTSGTGRPWVQVAEGEQITISLKSG